MNSKRLSREEVAKIEIGHTSSSVGVNWFLTIAFIAVIFTVPVLQNLREFADIHAGREVGRKVPQSWEVFSFLLPSRDELRPLFAEQGENLAVGGTAWPVLADLTTVFAVGRNINTRMLRDIKAYETELADRDALMQWVVPRMQIPVTAWLKGGNEDAYCGRDGWLFYRRDIDSLTSCGFLEPDVLRRRAAMGSELESPPQPNPVRAVVDFRDQLARRGISLIVMPTPVKPAIYPEFYSSQFLGRNEAVRNPSYPEFLRRLAERGIAVFDPAPLFIQAKVARQEAPLYLKTDTHWSPRGMELSARALAAFIREQVNLPPATDRYSRGVTTIQSLGDVANMFNFPVAWGVFQPETVTIGQVLDGMHYWRPQVAAEILFLGDSFANIYSFEPMGWGEAAGFVEHLSLALGLPVDAICRNDAGAYATREMLTRELQRGNDRLAGKKVVVWQFAARELVFGDWKLLPMELGDRRPADHYVPASGRPVEVQGVIRAASPAPRPGSVPYKDHIVMLHLSEIESVDDPAANGEEAVILAWSMRDNVATDASRLRAGDAVELRLHRWSDVAERYDAINRSELDDEDLMFAEPAWGEILRVHR